MEGKKSDIAVTRIAGVIHGTSRPGFITFKMMDGVLYSITPVHAIPFNFVLHYSIKRLPCDPPRGHFYPVAKQHNTVPDRGTDAGKGPPAAKPLTLPAPPHTPLPLGRIPVNTAWGYGHSSSLLPPVPHPGRPSLR